MIKKKSNEHNSICNLISEAIKDEEKAVPFYMDLYKKLSDSGMLYPLSNESLMLHDIIADETRHKENLEKIASLILCKRKVSKL